MDKFLFEICLAGVIFETPENCRGAYPVYGGRIFSTTFIGPKTAPPDGYVYRQHASGEANAKPEDYAALDAAMELHRQIPCSIYVRDSKKISVDGQVAKIFLFGTDKIRYQWSSEDQEMIHDRNWNFDLIPELFVWVREGKRVEVVDVPDDEKFRLMEQALPARVRTCSLRRQSGFMYPANSGAVGETPHCPECKAEFVSVFSKYYGHP